MAQPTGMARVLSTVAGRLGRHREIEVLGTDAIPGSVGRIGRHPEGFTSHGNPKRHDLFAERELEHLCATRKFDSVVLYQDPWHIPRLQHAFRDSGIPVAAYCPVDGAILRPAIVAGLSTLSGLAVPTQFGACAVTSCASRIGIETRIPFDRIAVLPHGIDTTAFSPWGGPVDQFEMRRGAARRHAFPERPDLWTGFLVLNPNRNHARKRLDLTLRGFAIFAAGKPPDVRLYLHWGAERTGPDVSRMALRMGIENRVVVPSHGGGVSTAELNLLYNAADVGVNTSLGEGWGLPSFEHAATGAAQVVPAHSACAELWRRGGALLLEVRRAMTLTGVVEGGEISPYDLAAALEHLYADPSLRGRTALAAYENARSDTYQWDHIAESWHDWLLAIERAPTASPKSGKS